MHDLQALVKVRVFSLLVADVSLLLPSTMAVYCLSEFGQDLGACWKFQFFQPSEADLLAKSQGPPQSFTEGMFQLEKSQSTMTAVPLPAEPPHHPQSFLN